MPSLVLWKLWKAAGAHRSPSCQHRESHDGGLEANGPPQTDGTICTMQQELQRFERRSTGRLGDAGSSATAAALKHRARALRG